MIGQRTAKTNTIDSLNTLKRRLHTAAHRYQPEDEPCSAAMIFSGALLCHALFMKAALGTRGCLSLMDKSNFSEPMALGQDRS